MAAMGTDPDDEENPATSGPPNAPALGAVPAEPGAEEGPTVVSSPSFDELEAQMRSGAGGSPDDLAYAKTAMAAPSYDERLAQRRAAHRRAAAERPSAGAPGTPPPAPAAAPEPGAGVGPAAPQPGSAAPGDAAGAFDASMPKTMVLSPDQWGPGAAPAGEPGEAGEPGAPTEHRPAPVAADAFAPPAPAAGPPAAGSGHPASSAPFASPVPSRGSSGGNVLLLFLVGLGAVLVVGGLALAAALYLFVLS
jgi:translation initiation factor IF-2